VISLTHLRHPIRFIERIILDVRVVEGMEGELVVEEEYVAPMVTEAEMSGVVVDEELPVADVVEEEDMDGELVDEEPMTGVFTKCG
jgi:hypothetical protein